MHQQRAFLGFTHTPLLHVAPLPAAAEATLQAAIARTRALVREWQPDRILLIGPDHYNGFVHELMPPFCIGTEATAVGDYLTPTGALNVDETTALALAEQLLDSGFDIAVSRRMRVDHGFAQPLMLLWDGLDTPPVVPVFMNAIAWPAVARIRRCIEIGDAMGLFLDGIPGRTLLLASGGLSHEPPIPTLQDSDPGVRERIMTRTEVTEERRRQRMALATAYGQALARGEPGMKPLNMAWDRRWADAIESRDLSWFHDQSEESISRQGGLAAHESKTWLIARCALSQQPQPSGFRHHQELPELIAGFGIMWIASDTEQPR